MIKSQRIAVSVAFLAFGAACTTWVPRLPALKDHLHLTDGQVGLALLAYAVGAVVGAAAARLVLARGARAFVQAGTVALCVALIGPGLAADFTQLFASLLLIGATAGFIDVLENAQAAELERKADRPLINGFHGFWSLGAIIGSVSAGAAAYAGVTPLVQFIAVGGIVVVATAWILRDLPDTRSGAARVMPVDAGRLWLTGSILAVAAISLGSYLVEGGTADWSALFLSELSHANPGIAAAGFAGFSTAAAVVRFRADLLTAHTSPTVVARLGASIAVVGLALAIAVPALPGAVTGFALVGIGTAVLVPLAFSAAANLGHSGTALALALASGYAGSIVGPVLIGSVADHFGLRAAMTVPLVSALVIVVLAGSLTVSRAAVSPQPARR